MSKALLAVGLVVLAVGCTHTPGVDEADTDSEAYMQQVTGTLSCRERLMLRPGTVAEVSLLDVSRAVIRQEDRLLFTTDTVYPVITRGAGNTVDLLLKWIGRPTRKPDASLTNTCWKLGSVGSETYRAAGGESQRHPGRHPAPVARRRGPARVRGSLLPMAA